MKKKECDILLKRGMYKVWLIMRLTVFFTMCLVFSVSANSYSQVTRLSLSCQNTLVTDILQDIERTSEFIFIYEKGTVDKQLRKTLEVENQPIQNILDELFLGTKVNYKIDDRQVLLYRTSVKEEKIPLLQPILREDIDQPRMKEIRGNVKDKAGIPLPGVTVIVKGTTTGTVTDESGSFSLQVPLDVTSLQFSFVGMTSQDVSLDGKTEVNVIMEEEAVGIEEVVAVGYGIQKKATVTGSVATVNSNTLEKITSSASTNNVLAGRLPGLISRQLSGSPGRDAASINIRGFGDALVIVDGVESRFNNIGTEEIESISILKDASAAIYGARAGNGVILVTTKRGDNLNPIINFESNYTLQSITDYPNMMNAGQYAQFQREYYQNQGIDPDSKGYSEANVKKYFDGTDPNYPNTNWRKLLLKDNAPLQKHELSVRGGSDKINFYANLGYLDQESIWVKSGGGLERINIRCNIDAKVSNNLSFQLDFSDIIEKRTSSAREHDPKSNTEQWLWNDLWATLPIYPSFLPDETKLPYAGNTSVGGAHLSSNRDIFGAADENNEYLKIAAGFTYNISFVKGLMAKYLLTFDRQNLGFKVFQKPVVFYNYDYGTQQYSQAGSWSPGSDLYQSTVTTKNITSQLSLSYEHIFNVKHHFKVLALFETIDYRSDWWNAGRQGFITSSLPYFDNGGSSQTVGGNASEMGRMSYVSRVNYAFYGKYLAEVTFRADASAKFAASNRWGFFPSLSVGWRMSDEFFIKDNIDWINNLKLRASIGEMGYDNVSNYNYLSGYSVGKYTGPPYNPTQLVQYVYGNQGSIVGIIPTSMANPDLTWEKMTLYNLGLDYAFFNSKLYGEINAFYRIRQGIPGTQSASLPSTFGANPPIINLNSQDNRGFEFVIGTKQTIGNFIMDVNGNVSWARAKWIDYDEPDYSEDPDAQRIQQISGKWVDQVVGYKTDGLYTSQAEIDAMTFIQDGLNNVTIKPGDIKYIDLNNDKILDWRDQQVIGKGNMPLWMFGLSTILRYKNFDFSMLLQGSTGYSSSISIGNTAEQQYTEAWSLNRNNNANALIPRPGSTAAGGGWNDFYLRDAGYVRLKNLNLGYNLPSNLLKRIRCQSFRLFFEAGNAFTYNKLKRFGYDPELGSSFSNYPIQRTLTFGFSLKL